MLLHKSLIPSLKSWNIKNKNEQKKQQHTTNKKKKWRQTKTKNMINCILLKKLYTTEISITENFQTVPVN